jgi:hypothetical protein
MNYKGVLKRLLPFAATFLVALFITSFFVDLHRPRFGEWRASGWERHSKYERAIRENEELRNENLRLKNEIESNQLELDDIRGAVPPPPMAPMAPGVMRLRRVQ